MVDMDLVLLPNDSCPVREIGDGLVVMSPDGGTAHSLDRIGAFIWRRLDGHTNLETIAAALTENYDVDLERARADLTEFVTQLREADLVKIV